MTDEEKLDSYNKGFKAGREHSTSSKETLKFMEKTEKQFNLIWKKMEQLPTVEGMKLANRELVEEIMDKSNKRFAPKWTERVLIFTMSTFGVGIIGAILFMVLK